MNTLVVNFLFILVIISYSSGADEYHYKNLPHGSKAAGLGGAYIAVANDLTAMIYNPAGLSNSTTSTTASINILSWDRTSFNNVFSDGSDFERESFVIVPGFFAFRAKSDVWDLGLSFAVTNFSRERTSKDAIFDITQNELNLPQRNNEFIYIDLDNSAYKFGGSIAFKKNDTLSFGASLYLNYKEFVTLQGSGIASTFFLANEQTLEAGFNASRRITDINISAEPIIAMLWRRGGFSLGIKAAYDIAIKRDYEVIATIFLTSIEPLPPQINTVSRVRLVSDTKQKFPFELSIGGRYQLGQLRLSADINYFSTVNSNNVSLGVIETPITRDLKKTINWAMGLAYPVTKKTTLRLGLSSDYSNGKIDTTIANQRVEDIDLIGISAAVETEFEKNIVTFGLYYKQGQGRVRYADIRAVEHVVGLSLYPENDRHDITEAEKKSLVFFMSVDF